MAGLTRFPHPDRPWVSWPLAVLLAIVGIGTLGSLLPSTAWYLRIFDFLLELLLYASFLGAMAALLTARWRPYLIGGFALFALIHLVRIWPYVIIAPHEIELGKPEGSECFTLLTLNVLQKNRDYERTLDLIRARDPDLLLLTETDQPWMDALMPVLENYPHRLAEPLDNTYGMIFATRLPVQRSMMPTDRVADAPTLYAKVTVPDAGDFELIGLHPRPPEPGQDVERRDKMIAEAGMLTPDGLEDALAIGDFNDVPWSQTTQAFRTFGKYSDPRAGRGTYPTFPSFAGKLGWPLDHLFVKGNLHVRSFVVLDDVGSDHRPLAAEICMLPEARD